MKDPKGAELILAAHKAALECLDASEKVIRVYGEMRARADSGRRPTQPYLRRMEKAASDVEAAVETAQRFVPLARAFFVVGLRRGAVSVAGVWGATAHDAAIEIGRRFLNLGWTAKLWTEAVRKAWDGRSKRLDPDKLSRFMRKHKMRDTTAHPLKIDYKTEHRAELEFEQTVAYHNLSERAARLRLAALGEAEILDNDLPELTESQLEILRTVGARRLEAQEIADEMGRKKSKVKFNTAFQNRCTELRKRGFLDLHGRGGYFQTPMGRTALEMWESRS